MTRKISCSVHKQQVKLKELNKKFELDIQEHRDTQEKTCESNKSEPDGRTSGGKKGVRRENN